MFLKNIISALLIKVDYILKMFEMKCAEKISEHTNYTERKNKRSFSVNIFFHEVM